MIYSAHLLNLVVIPVLQALDMDSLQARKLIMGTAAKESHLGKYLKQRGAGPALGIYQIEPSTNADIVLRYLHRPDNKDMLRRFRKATNASIYGNSRPWTDVTDEEFTSLLTTDLKYQTAVCRIKYWMVPDPLPDRLYGLAQYWDTYYNANPSKGTAQEFQELYYYYKLQEIMHETG